MEAKQINLIDDKNQMHTIFWEEGQILSEIIKELEKIHNTKMRVLSDDEYNERVYNVDYYRDNKLMELEKAKNKDINSDVFYNGNYFQNRETDRNLLTSTITLYQNLGELPKGFVWISRDNKQIEVTLQDLINIGALMGAKVNEVAIKARNLKDKVVASDDKDYINSITWEG